MVRNKSTAQQGCNSTKNQVTKRMHQEKQPNIVIRFFYSVGRHLRVLAIAAAFSTVVYGGMYLILHLTGRM